MNEHALRESPGTDRRMADPSGAARAEVSVIVPTRNRRNLLRRAVRSILAQRDVALALIVVDEASDDGTAEFLQRHPDPRLRWIRHAEPKGNGGARNAGLAAVRTPFVAFCDDDDLWAPDRVRAMLDALETVDGPAWCTTGEIRFLDGEHAICGLRMPPPDGDLSGALIAFNCVPGGGSAVLTYTALMREAGGFREDLAAAVDWECWIRLAQRAPHVGVARPLMAYSITPGSHSHSIDRLRKGVAQVRAIHAARAAALGVAHDHARDTAHIALQAARMGARMRASLLHGRLAFRHGQTRQLVYALLSLVAPRQVARLRDRRGAGHAEPAEVEAAWRWLGPLLGEPADRPASTRF